MMYDKSDCVDLDIVLTASITVTLRAEESLDGFDVNQDVVSMLAEDFERWLTSRTHTKMVCEEGEQVVSIETNPCGVNVSDVTGEDGNNIW